MNRLFASRRAHLESLYGLGQTVATSYDKFSVRGIPHAITTLFSGPMVMLPQNQIKNVFNRPEAEIDGQFAQNDTIQAFYTIGEEEIYVNNFHFRIVRNQLTRNIASFSEQIAEELQVGLDHHWGAPEEWETIRMWEFCLKVIARAANRVFVGPTLCRDEIFLEEARKYAMSIFGGALVIRMFPTFLIPVIGRLVGLKCKWQAYKVERAIRPIVVDRIEKTIKSKRDAKFKWGAPDDGLQWVIEECIKTGDLKQLSPRLIVKRILILNMVAMHSTSFTTANTLLDLFSSPTCNETVSVLREECDRALQEADGAWTRLTVTKLHHTDSTIRESMRRSGFGIAALPRMVSLPSGLDIHGQTISKGVKLAVAMHQIHPDEAFYSNPTTFDAFRFSRPALTTEQPRRATAPQRQDCHIAAAESAMGCDDYKDSKVEHLYEKARPLNPNHYDDDRNPVSNHDGGDGQDDDGDDEDRNPPNVRALSATTVSDHFLTFGYGRHACPGRFFATHEMKILLALILQNYDIQPLARRPPDQTLVEVKVPSEYTTVRIRRRRKEKQNAAA